MLLRRLGLRFHLGLAPRLALCAGLTALLALPSLGLSADDVQATFRKGVELLRAGKETEALAAFQQVLAMDPSHEAAYELWKNTDQQIWLEMLAQQGQMELAAKRLMGLAELGHKARRDDAAAIKGLLEKVGGNNVLERKQAVRALASEHGEYAVPYMLNALANAKNDDRAVLFIQALSDMGDDVVLPLVEALDSPDAHLRRNVALTLGYVGDRRAAGSLTWTATGDSDVLVQKAAMEALGRMGGPVDAYEDALEMGEAYHLGAASVLRTYRYSDVVWTWREGKLSHAPVPRAIYGDELAKKSYHRALKMRADDPRAYAGLARVLAGEQSKLAHAAAGGQDAAALSALAEQAAVALNAVGVDALDLALSDSLRQMDDGVAIGLVRSLARCATEPSEGLGAALAHPSGGVRSEAALALAHIALSNGAHPDGGGAWSSDTVVALGEAASREVMRIVVLVDPRAVRATALSAALREQGVLVETFPSGTQALAALRRMPGADLVLLSDELPDMTAAEVLSELRDPDAGISAPVVLVSGDPSKAGEIWGDKIAGAISGAEDLGALKEPLSGSLNRDREEAAKLALRAATSLAHCAMAGLDVTPALPALTEVLAGRPDELTLAALGAIGRAGGESQAAALIALAGDGQRGEVVRVAALEALAGIIGRDPAAGEAHVAALLGMCSGDGTPLGLRAAAVRVLGRMALEPAARAELLRKLRVDVRG